MKLFREKIVEDVKGYTCKFCEFASGNRMLAKTHAVYCGVKQQKRRKRPKLYNCTECAESFQAKAEVDKHFRSTHLISSYECSTCDYKSDNRRNFVKHLRSHDNNYIPGFKCDVCSFNAKDKWHIEKHKMSHFKDTNTKNLNGPLSTYLLPNEF